MSKWAYTRLLIKMKWNMFFKKRQQGSVFIYEAEDINKRDDD